MVIFRWNFFEIKNETHFFIIEFKILVVSTPTQTLPMMSTLPMVPGASQQAGFLFRSLWLPLIVTFPTGQSKSTLYVTNHFLVN